MSTVAVVPSSETVASMPVKRENINFAVVFEVDEHGAPVRDAKGNVKPPRHTSSENDIYALKGLDKNGKQSATPYAGSEMIAFEQTVVKPSVGTLDGFFELVPDKEEQLNIINKGISSKFNQKIRTKLIEQNEDGSLVFQPTDAVYDATTLVQEVSERITLSPADKVIKLLSGLDENMRAAILDRFAAIAAGQNIAS
jgi:hypothetical protein